MSVASIGIKKPGSSSAYLPSISTADKLLVERHNPADQHMNQRHVLDMRYDSQMMQSHNFDYALAFPEQLTNGYIRKDSPITINNQSGARVDLVATIIDKDTDERRIIARHDDIPEGLITLNYLSMPITVQGNYGGPIHIYAVEYGDSGIDPPLADSTNFVSNDRLIELDWSITYTSYASDGLIGSLDVKDITDYSQMLAGVKRMAITGKTVSDEMVATLAKFDIPQGLLYTEQTTINVDTNQDVGFYQVEIPADKTNVLLDISGMIHPNLTEVNVVIADGAQLVLLQTTETSDRSLWITVGQEMYRWATPTQGVKLLIRKDQPTVDLSAYSPLYIHYNQDQVQIGPKTLIELHIPKTSFGSTVYPMGLNGIECAVDFFDLHLPLTMSLDYSSVAPNAPPIVRYDCPVITNNIEDAFYKTRLLEALLTVHMYILIDQSFPGVDIIRVVFSSTSIHGDLSCKTTVPLEIRQFFQQTMLSGTPSGTLLTMIQPEIITQEVQTVQTKPLNYFPFTTMGGRVNTLAWGSEPYKEQYTVGETSKLVLYDRDVTISEPERDWTIVGHLASVPALQYTIRSSASTNAIMLESPDSSVIPLNQPQLGTPLIPVGGISFIDLVQYIYHKGQVPLMEDSFVIDTLDSNFFQDSTAELFSVLDGLTVSSMAVHNQQTFEDFVTNTYEFFVDATETSITNIEGNVTEIMENVELITTEITNIDQTITSIEQTIVSIVGGGFVGSVATFADLPTTADPTWSNGVYMSVQADESRGGDRTRYILTDKDAIPIVWTYDFTYSSEYEDFMSTISSPTPGSPLVSNAAGQAVEGTWPTPVDITGKMDKLPTGQVGPEEFLLIKDPFTGNVMESSKDLGLVVMHNGGGVPTGGMLPVYNNSNNGGILLNSRTMTIAQVMKTNSTSNIDAVQYYSTEAAALAGSTATGNTKTLCLAPAE